MLEEFRQRALVEKHVSNFDQKLEAVLVKRITVNQKKGLSHFLRDVYARI